jgi:alkaline phosphatase D
VVIVLSWDGVRHDYPERATTPGLDRMELQGTRAGRFTVVFPTNTFPSHVGMATGTHPDRHGIVANTFRDLQRGRYFYSNDASWIDAEPVWAAAERQGVKAATFFWVGSETDWNGVGASYRRAPFDGAIPEAEKVDQILAWLDLPETERPGLIMSWWHGCDHVGHERGPDHPEVDRQLERQDAQLARLLAGLDGRDVWADTTLMVVSDHGMAEVSEIVDVIGPLEDAGVQASLVAGGGMAFVWLKRSEQLDRALEVLQTLDGVRAWPSDAMPAGMRSYRVQRSGHITVLTEPPGVFYRPRGLDSILLKTTKWLGRKRGSHGFRAEHPDMGAIFYALGRGVPAGARLGEVHATDLAATVARLLGIEPPRHSEGKPIFSAAVETPSSLE